MAITNYTELTTAIANWLDDATLTSRIPEFIALAEAKINDDVRIRSMEKRSISTLTTADRYQTLPARFAQAKRLWLLTSPITVVAFVGSSQLANYYSTSSGKPLYYTITANEIELNRISDSAYTAEMVYWQKVSPISVSNQTNVIITEYPNIYLYGSLSESAPYIDDQEKINLWAQLYENAVELANLAARDATVPHGPIRAITNAGRP